MPNHNQAPKIRNNGVKDRRSKELPGYSNRSTLLEEKIMQGIDSRQGVALKVMLFLTGNAEGFGIALKTITERLNITQTAYYNARKYLVELGWITCTKDAIIVNYDVIYGMKTTTELTTTENTSKESTTTELQSIENRSMAKTTTELISTELTTTQNIPLTTTELKLKTTTENTHNNIIGDNINNNISEPQEDAVRKFMNDWGF